MVDFFTLLFGRRQRHDETRAEYVNAVSKNVTASERLRELIEDMRRDPVAVHPEIPNVHPNFEVKQ